MSYDVFLCHNQADKPAVEELENLLYAANVSAWFDKADLTRGVPWTTEVERCLTEECKSCAVIIGPSGLGPWQQQEMRVALNRQVESGRNNGSFPVIPVLLPGSDSKSLPAFLNGHTYVAFRRSLDETEAFDELVRAIRGLPPAPRRRGSEGCPFRGLEYFDVSHAAYFHGREEMTRRLLAKLWPSGQIAGSRRFLAIIGASGSGKSSLARAGLLAALAGGAVERSRDWPIVISRPGSDPCANLAIELGKWGGSALSEQAAFKDRLKDRMGQDAAALHESVELILPSHDPQARLVILIDQFEELFTICQDEKSRKAFIDNMLHAAQVESGRTVVVIAMRADFYGKCGSSPQLALAVPECQVLVGPMSEAELREAIEKPVQQVGCELESGLVTLLLKEVADQPGSLPYLQFGLRELWNKRSGRKLTTDAYWAMGGVTGALKRKADEVYASLGEAERRICRRVFLRLTQPGEGSEDTKRRVALSELGPTNQPIGVSAVLLKLCEPSTRLVVTGEAENGQQFVEVAHEALIRGWPQLRTWIDADRTALITHRRLTEAVQQWADNQRDASFLYRGARLAAAEKWARANAEEMNQPESEFLAASRRQARWQQAKIAAAVTVVLSAGIAGWLYISHQHLEESNRTQAAALVEELINADTAEVPGIVRRLEQYRTWADPLLKRQYAQAGQDPKRKLHLALALLPVEKGKVMELAGQLPLASASQFPLLRDTLAPYKASIVESLWSAALDSQREGQPRFQAACALASYAPADPRWSRIKDFVAHHLVRLEASPLVAWRKAIAPAGEQLIAPLSTIFRDPKEKEQARTSATETLAEFLADRPSQLFDLLADAADFQFSPLFRKLATHKSDALSLCNQQLRIEPHSEDSEQKKEGLATRQANAAVALFRLGSPDAVWELLKDRPDPRFRSDVVHWLSGQEEDWRPILARFDSERDVTIRKTLLLILGQFSQTQLRAADRQRVIEKVAALYRDDPDAGLHGAAEWLLRKWGQGRRIEAIVEQLKSNEKQLKARQSENHKRWYVNTQLQTFVILDPQEFFMGSPDGEPDHQPDEILHRQRIGRQIAVAAHEVTKSEFERFQNERPDVKRVDTHDWVKTDDSPQVQMTWYEAVAYCNWLSEREGIDKSQWCYEPNKKGEFAAGMKAKEKFWQLNGYRLPTEAEWECACRAGSVTSRYYGVSTKLLSQYAWYVKDGESHSWPIGQLEPNQWGLMDVLGNALEWCYDASHPYPAPKDIAEDHPPTEPVDDATRRVVRGGAFLFLPRSVRSAYRNYFAPDSRPGYIGFRPVRTYPNEAVRSVAECCLRGGI